MLLLRIEDIALAIIQMSTAFICCALLCCAAFGLTEVPSAQSHDEIDVDPIEPGLNSENSVSGTTMAAVVDEVGDGRSSPKPLIDGDAAGRAEIPAKTVVRRLRWIKRWVAMFFVDKEQTNARGFRPAVMLAPGAGLERRKEAALDVLLELDGANAVVPTR